MFHLLCRHDTEDGILDDFPKISDYFPKTSKIFQNCSKGQTNIPEHFPEISEDFRRFPKTFNEDPKMFQSHTNEFKYNLRDKLDISEIINIFTSADWYGKYATRVPDVVLYEFYK